MSKSRRLSSASGASRPLELQWRPSRQVAAALGALAALAPYSLLACELPLGWRLPLALLAGVAGAWTVRRYLAEPPMTLAIPAGRGCARRDGQPIDGFQVRWRGPLAFLRWREPDGRYRHAACFPDTLPAAARRELKLAMQRREAAGGDPTMAG